MIKKIINFCATVIVCSFSSYSDAKNPVLPETFVASQKVIRIFVENAAGYGDQAASLNAMDHLQRMGFTGRFEVIYPDDRATRSKIITLFSLPQNIDGNYLDTKHNILFLDFPHQLERIRQHRLDHIALAVNGGMGDDPCSADDGSCGPAGNDDLAFLGVDNFIMVGPFVRYPSYAWYLDAQGQRHDHVEIVGSGDASKYFVSYSPQLSEVQDYLQNDPQGQALVQKKPALPVLLDAMATKKINFMPVYGFSIQAPERYQSEVNAYSKMLEILSGVRYAQLNGGASAGKPLIIAVFYDYTAEAEHLQLLINSDNWGTEEKPESPLIRAAIKSLGLNHAISFVGITDPSAGEKIKQLQPGKILLLWLGPLPKNVFDGLYNYADTNIWPPIREGASSLNSLLITGKAHFRCASTRMRGVPGALSWEIGYDLIDDQAFKSRLSSFYNRFCSDTDTQIPWSIKPQTYVQLGQLIIESFDPASSIAQYFSRLKKEALNPENDKIYYDIKQVINRGE